MVLVSHDRHLLRTTTDELATIEAGALNPCDLDLAQYTVDAEANRSPAPAGENRRTVRARPDGPGHSDRKTRRRRAALARQRLQPVVDRIRRIEKLLTNAGNQQAASDAALADPALYEPAQQQRLESLLFERARAARDLESLENEWLELQKSLEALS